MNHQNLSNIETIEVRELQQVTIRLKGLDHMRSVFVDKEHAPDLTYSQFGNILLVSQEKNDERKTQQELFLYIGPGVTIKADGESKPLLENQEFVIEDL